LNKLGELTLFGCREDAFQHPVQRGVGLAGKGLVVTLRVLFPSPDHDLKQGAHPLGHQRSFVVFSGQLCAFKFDQFKLNSFISIAAIALKVKQDGLEVFSGHSVNLASIFAPSDHRIDLSMVQFRAVLPRCFLKDNPCEVQTCQQNRS